MLLSSRQRNLAAGAMQDDRRDCDRRLGGKPILDRLQRRIARRLIIAVAIGLDHDLDKIRVVKGRRLTRRLQHSEHCPIRRTVRARSRIRAVVPVVFSHRAWQSGSDGEPAAAVPAVVRIVVAELAV